MTLDELKVLKGERDRLKKELESTKGESKKTDGYCTFSYCWP